MTRARVVGAATQNAMESGGATLIAYDHILLRTGAHPTMQFLKFLFGMYIGSPGAPVAETFWLDDLTVATARP